jgi:hypothetical protein
VSDHGKADAIRAAVVFAPPGTPAWARHGRVTVGHDDIGVSPSHGRRVLSELARRGVLKRCGGGIYRRTR